MKKNGELNTPVVLIIYKRSATLQKIINELRNVNAKKIYVVADGPKNKDEIEDIISARKEIDLIDWDANIIKIYSEENLGLYSRVISGLDVVFENETKAIILEDDCIPNRSFFSFTSKLLDVYLETKEIAIISGTNLGINMDFNHDYDFVNYPLIWGWATWRRTWHQYRQIQPLKLNPIDKAKINKLLNDKVASFHWINLFKKIENNKHKSWAHEMVYYLFTDSKLSVIPKLNMVSNHGIDAHATHTKKNSRYFYIKSSSLTRFRTHPGPISRNQKMNVSIQKSLYTGNIRSILSFFIQKYILLR
jgi:hypothetical protein